ncbi:MAG: zinc ribbon domain-containing protein [Thermoplasmata archaeon]|nr:zinc ribbon domain-containing protein [Thermoplasmata archaeon]
MAKCPSCGTMNPNYIIYCGKCGQEIPEAIRKAAESEPESATAETASTSAIQQPTVAPVASQEATKKCNWCGTYNKTSANFCSNCGRDPYRVSPYDAGSAWEPPQESPNTSAPLIGGILAILAGVLSLGQGVIYSVASDIAYTMGYDAGGFLCMCGGLGILFGLASIVGGIFSIQRKNFGLAVIGAVLGMIGFGFVIGFLLGLIAVILIAISRVEFRD